MQRITTKYFNTVYPKLEWWENYCSGHYRLLLPDIVPTFNLLLIDYILSYYN